MPQTRAAQRRSLARKCTPHVVVGMSDAFGCRAAPGVAPRSLGALALRSPRRRAVEDESRRPCESHAPCCQAARSGERRAGPHWRKLPVPAVPAARSRQRRSPQSGTRRRATRPEARGPCRARRAVSPTLRRAICERRRPARNAVRARSVQRGRAMSPPPSARSRQPQSSASNESRDLRVSRTRGKRASRDPAAERLELCRTLVRPRP